MEKSVSQIVSECPKGRVTVLLNGRYSYVSKANGELTNYLGFGAKIVEAPAELPEVEEAKTEEADKVVVETEKVQGATAKKTPARKTTRKPRT